MTDRVGRRLQAVHSGLIEEPLPEGIENASCGPAVKHLAHLAMHTAAANGTEAAWREWVHANVPEVSDKLIDDAEECMRWAGLWPWHE